MREGLLVGDGGPLRLVAGVCASCGAVQFPRPVACAQCGGSIDERHLDGEGATLWGWTSVQAAPPGYTGPVPYGFGVVELVEGVRIVTRLTESDPSRLSFGQPMRLVADVVDVDTDADPDGVEVVAWAFAPADGPAADGEAAS